MIRSLNSALVQQRCVCVQLGMLDTQPRPQACSECSSHNNMVVQLQEALVDQGTATECFSEGVCVHKLYITHHLEVKLSSGQEYHQCSSAKKSSMI